MDLTVSQLLPNWIVFEGAHKIKWPIFVSFASGLRRQRPVSHPSTPVVEGREGLTHLSLNSVNEECPHGAIGNKPAIMLLNHDGATGPPS